MKAHSHQAIGTDSGNLLVARALALRIQKKIHNQKIGNINTYLSTIESVASYPDGFH